MSYKSLKGVPILLVAAYFLVILATISGCSKWDPYVVNSDPETEVYTPYTTLSGEQAPVSFVVRDFECESVAVIMHYSIDNGATYRLAHISGGGLNLESLNTSNVGIRYTIYWDTVRDKVALDSAEYEVRVKILASDISRVGESSPSDCFPVNNSVNNNAPSIEVTSPVGEKKETVAVNFGVSDPDSDLLAVEVYYSLDNGATFEDASPASGSAQQGGIQGTSGMQYYTFLWDSLSDGVAENQSEEVILRFAVSDGVADDVTVDTDPFEVNNGLDDGATIFVDVSNETGIEDGTLANPYQKLQDAIDICNSGWTIRMAQGEYKETIVIPDNLTIIGAGPTKTIIKRKVGDNTITIGDPSYDVFVSLKNLQVTNSRTGEDVGGVVAYNNHGTIRNVIFYLNLGCGLVADGGNMTVLNCTFTQNYTWGMHLATSGTVVYLKNSILARNHGYGT